MISIIPKYRKISVKKVLFHSFTLSLFTSALALTTSCYDNLGGNDHDTVLDDVVITLPSDAYSASLGSTITIEPTVKTDIPESDLEYHWEAKGAIKNQSGREAYTKLLNDEDQAKTLNYVCHLDSNITALNTSYPCRLHVRQKSTGRDFYSASTFTITIAGVTGLMILHDDGSQSEIGLLEAEEFMPAAISIPEEPQTTVNHYSIANGTKIDGKGKSIVQSVVTMWGWENDEFFNRCRIVTTTDKGVNVSNMADFSYYGDWSSFFYLQGEKQNYDNNPQGYQPLDQYAFAWDGNDMFVMAQRNTYPFLFPEFTAQTVCGDGHSFVFAPVAQEGKGTAQAIFYANSVDGDEDHRGFVFLGQLYYSYRGSYAEKVQLIDTQDDVVPFNPGNTKADLVKMTFDSRQHVVAILNGRQGNTYNGQYYAVDIDPAGGSIETGTTSYGGYPKYLYDLSALTDISSARFFDFGSTVNMCYYATSGGVYHYSMNNGTVGPCAKLTMTDGSAIAIDGEVTMMKMLDSPNIDTHNEDEILLVATYTGSNAKLYALHLDSMTGLVTRVSKYDETTVKGWNYGYIRDVNIKGV